MTNFISFEFNKTTLQKNQWKFLNIFLGKILYSRKTISSSVYGGKLFSLEKLYAVV